MNSDNNNSSSNSSSGSSHKSIKDLTKPHVSREDIQKMLGGMRPKNLENYRKALLHKSMKKEIKEELNRGGLVCSYMIENGKPASNERLEFLGDAVLNLIVGEYIYDKYVGKDEGFMTRLRTKIVRDTHCVKFAKIINLGEHIMTGSIVKRKNNIICSNKLLEDSFEAFLGAIKLDLGYEFAKGFVIKLIEQSVDFENLLEDDNYKDILMRYVQGKGIPLPMYKEIKQIKVGNRRTFHVEVVINIDGREVRMGEGTGECKKDAEQSAAHSSLKLIESSDLKEILERDKF
jgi:ribonuclease-3